MKTIKIDLYKFYELSEETREKILKKYLDSDKYSFIYDDQLNFFTEDVRYELKELGFYDINFYCSFSYCQGDGCCFSGQIDPIEFNVLFHNDKNLSLKIIKENDRYNHYNTVEFYFYDEYGNEFYDDDLETDVKNWYKEKMYEFEKRGYNILDIDNIKSYLIDYLTINDQYFLPSGEEFNG